MGGTGRGPPGVLGGVGKRGEQEECPNVPLECLALKRNRNSLNPQEKNYWVTFTFKFILERAVT